MEDHYDIKAAHRLFRGLIAVKFFIPIAIASLGLASCTFSETAPVYQAPQFQIPKETVKTVAVAPPEVQITRESSGDVRENLPDVEKSAAGDLTSLVADQMRQHGL